ncbi:MAG: hypothetical protein IT158_02755 [Bryobacterales bacterium]|nr:hypothetical protein [Bryobacterales bacterium]
MGFAVWLDGDLAWAKGTHEYRPMGVAVIAASDLFAARDFSPRRKPPSGNRAVPYGLFASLGEVNGWLIRRRSGSRLRRPSLPHTFR